MPRCFQSGLTADDLDNILQKCKKNSEMKFSLFILNRVENIASREEIVYNELFLFFPQYVQKSSAAVVSEKAPAYGTGLKLHLKRG